MARTEHFTVYWHESTAAIAPDVVQMCERAHELLAPVFGAPPFRTHVVLTDSFDSANGSATVVPLQIMRLQAMPPESSSSLGHFDNWMWNLIVHEYTHVLHLSRMSWPFRVFNLPAGRRAAPHQQLPRWLIEGIATWAESAFSGTGRVHQPLFQSYLRVMAFEDRFPTLGSLNGVPTWWPNGTAWYLFGGFFVDDLVREYGISALSEFLEVYGNRLIPFGISVSFEQATGRGIEVLWSDFQRRTRERATADHVRLTTAGLTPIDVVSDGSFGQRYVTATRDSRCMAWMQDDGVHPWRIRVRCADSPLVELNGPRRRHGGGAHSHGPTPTQIVEEPAEFDIHPDGRHVLISQTVGYRDGYAFRDLFEVDLQTGDWARLTNAARAREPRYSPSGAWIAFVQPVAGRTDLVVMERSTGAMNRVGTVEPWTQWSRPSWGHSDAELFASWHEPGQGRTIVRADLGTGGIVRITRGMSGHQYDPWWSDATGELYFTSDGGGFFDVHVWNANTGSIARLSRSFGGLHSPALWLDGTGETWVVASELTATGFRVVRFARTDTTAAAPVSPRVIPVPTSLQLSEFDGWQGGIEQSRQVERMNSLLRVRPFRWQPTLTSALGSTLYGLSANGGDPAGVHAFAADVQWESGEAIPVWQAGWTTQALPATLGLNTSGRPIERPERFQVGGEFEPYTELEWMAGASVSGRIPWIGSGHSLSGSWTFQRYVPTGSLDVIARPEDPVPQVPDRFRYDGVSVGWGWRDTWAANQSVSTERGTALGLSLRARSTQLGADADTGEVSWNGAQYIPMPWHSRHVLAVQAGGAFGRTRGVGRRLFAVGGLPAQDVLTALNGGLPYGTFHVRGYAPTIRVGDRYFLTNVEYRLPLVDLNAGAATLPVFLQRVWLAGFVDAGDAWDGGLRARNVLVSTGLELRLSAVLGYFEGAGLRLGYARGWTWEPSQAFWLVYGFQY
jgi:hypothetical protein